ncbi:MAG TPA: YHS domain-containing (seleno)protein [Candidatus Polarisedimenticolaceae bacterium]|nr:YHS domain-containing (seleno)protein [Candidatus Polarisedimenticolaceae bacterium]
MKRHLLAAALVLASAAVAVAGNEPTLVNVDRDGVILDGYDPVAFFTDGKPVLGIAGIQSTYHGAIYRFASSAHKALFDQDPMKYEPQFGAFCAYAVSVGRTAPIDVKTFSIINDRLVVQHNARAVGLWNKDPQANLKLADKYWPAVAANGGKQIKVDE